VTARQGTPGGEQLGFDLGEGTPPPSMKPPSSTSVDAAMHSSTVEIQRPENPSEDSALPALPDAAARVRIATDLGTNLLVEAGAGSGKTTALVSRMVALVREGAARVTEIAAVTFTRKAAGELRERFQEALEKERIGTGLPEAAVERLEAALQELDRAFMGTIHAFCARLLRERPIEAGIDPAFAETTAMQANALADHYWSLHLERLAATGDPILGELEAVGLTPQDLRGLYDDVRENLDVEFPLEASPLPDPADVARARDDVDRILDAAQRFPNGEEELEWDELRRRLRSIGYVRRYRKWADDRVFLDALADLCSHKTWKIVQYRWASDAAGKLAAKRICEAVNEVCAPGGHARTLLETWWAHRYQVSMRFAIQAARGLEAHRRGTGHLDFQDLLTLSATLLRGSAGARRDLGRRWSRLLVDEFQDTDPLQAEVLFLLASDPEGDGGDWTRAAPRPGALFVVGDPKQSIYRFRRADIALYAQVRRRFEDLGAVLSLTTNFRSGPPIGALVNGVFGPPHGFPEAGSDVQAPFAPLVPSPTRAAKAHEGVFQYEIQGKRWEDAALWDASALSDWIRKRVERGERGPGDFMILTRGKKEIQIYARALEARELPVQVSGGGAGVGVEQTVSELRLVLESLLDPDDPSLAVAVLVGAFFGLDHEQLLRHVEEGRTFDFRRSGLSSGAASDPVEDALSRLRGWWEVSRREPADVLVTRIAAELGLLAYAASGELGSIRAGALAFVLDSVRAGAASGDASLRGALDALEQATRDEEAEAPLEPGRADAIRLMNLHKAKGLEAPVVILAAPFGEWDPPTLKHIERSPDGRALGWFAVERRDNRNRRPLAQPRGWSEKRDAEQRFGNAEDLRLLYVAATRAGDELVVARRPEQSNKSPWVGLDPWLEANATRLDVAPANAPDRERIGATAEEMVRRVDESVRRRTEASEPTFAFRSVTGVAKGSPVEAEPSRDVRAPEPVDPSDGPSGYAWGSAVHGVLEAAARGARGDKLRVVARTLLLELERPVRNGEPKEIDLLLETARGVIESPLWERSRSASHALAEVPFALELAGSVPSTLLEGVIDLAFKEPDGWVVVDYKTDRSDAPDFESRRSQYREQLRIYSDAWERLTGEPVKERLLWFVRSREVEAVER
jgi:ATP-dependent helicase/nuclease subunit A